MYSSFSELLSQWPNQSRLADDLGAWPNNMTAYRAKNSLPSHYWVALVESARKNKIKGVTYKRLAELARDRKLAEERG